MNKTMGEQNGEGRQDIIGMNARVETGSMGYQTMYNSRSLERIQVEMSRWGWTLLKNDSPHTEPAGMPRR